MNDDMNNDEKEILRLHADRNAIARELAILRLKMCALIAENEDLKNEIAMQKEGGK